MSIEMIHQNTESLKELSNKYKFFLNKKESLESEISRIRDREMLKAKNEELNNVKSQIEKLKSLIATILIQMQKLIDDIQTKDANKLY